MGSPRQRKNRPWNKPQRSRGFSPFNYHPALTGEPFNGFKELPALAGDENKVEWHNRRRIPI